MNLRTSESLLRSPAVVNLMPVDISFPDFGHLITTERFFSSPDNAFGATNNSTPTSVAERHAIRDSRWSLSDSLSVNCSGSLSGLTTLIRAPLCDKSSKAPRMVEPSGVSISTSRLILRRANSRFSDTFSVASRPKRCVFTAGWHVSYASTLYQALPAVLPISFSMVRNRRRRGGEHWPREYSFHPNRWTWRVRQQSPPKEKPWPGAGLFQTGRPFGWGR